MINGGMDTMPRRCSICDHDQLDAINTVLVSGSESLRDIARRHAVSKDALARHKAKHLPKTLAQAQQAQEVTRGDSLLGRLLFLSNETLAILAEARQEKENSLALTAISRAEQQIALQGKLLGELREQQITVNTNLLVTSPEWVALRTRVVAALEPYPEARLAMVEAIDGSL